MEHVPALTGVRQPSREVVRDRGATDASARMSASRAAVSRSAPERHLAAQAVPDATSPCDRGHGDEVVPPPPSQYAQAPVRAVMVSPQLGARPATRRGAGRPHSQLLPRAAERAHGVRIDDATLEPAQVWPAGLSLTSAHGPLLRSPREPHRPDHRSGGTPATAGQAAACGGARRSLRPSGAYLKARRGSRPFDGRQLLEGVPGGGRVGDAGGEYDIAAASPGRQQQLHVDARIGKPAAGVRQRARLVGQ